MSAQFLSAFLPVLLMLGLRRNPFVTVDANVVLDSSVGCAKGFLVVLGKPHW